MKSKRKLRALIACAVMAVVICTIAIFGSASALITDASLSAGRAFEVVKEFTPKGETKKATVVLATVKGDIHDIGKNIVKLLLENYGYDVRDLGRDVPPQAVVDEVLRLGAPVAGLSALMTTTVPAMEETIRLLREQAPFCKVIVGGAVLTKSYAESIGADAYAADAMEAVRVISEVSR